VLTAELYPENRVRLLKLAEELSVAEAAAPVPALPGWSVKDAYAHLTGLCIDVVEGRLDGAGTPSWTARQVGDRADASLDEVCREWVTHGPDLDAWLATADDQRTVFVGYDVWNHHQDIRSAVGLVGERDPRQLPYLVASALAAFDRRFRDAEVPGLRVMTDTDAWDLGDGAPEATLHATDYETLRILFGRRSQEQILAARWEGSPAAYLDHLHLFELPTADLVD
jgi:uncharacterized protein (TIGR03083 family)